MAGVTYLNCLWQADANGWHIVPSYVDALLDIQGCTSVMEALASKWPFLIDWAQADGRLAITVGTASMRNTFEKIAEKVIRRLSSRPSSRPPERVADQTIPTNGGPASQNGQISGLEAAFQGIQDGALGLSWPQMVMPAFEENQRGGNDLDASLGDTLDNWLRLPIGTLTDLDWSYLGRN